MPFTIEGDTYPNPMGTPYTDFEKALMQHDGKSSMVFHGEIDISSPNMKEKYVYLGEIDFRYNKEINMFTKILLLVEYYVQVGTIYRNPGLYDNSPADGINRLIRDSVLGFNDNLDALKSRLDPDVYTDELLRRERIRLGFIPCFNSELEKVFGEKVCIVELSREVIDMNYMTKISEFIDMLYSEHLLFVWTK